MRPIAQVVSELRGLRVRLFEEAGQLRYQAPRGALGPRLMDEMRERKAELLEFCRQAQAGAAELPLHPVPREGALPIALAQQRLWLQDRIEGPSSAYNIAMAVRLRGHLDLQALQSALASIVQRHETLRTAFVSPADAEVRQHIAPSVPLPWNYTDLSGQPDAEDQALRLAREEAQRPFALGRAPLVRFFLWRLAEGDHVFLINMHHMVSDGGSLRIFARELSALYTEHLGGAPAALPALAIQYPDFAACQRRWLEDKRLASQLDYWRRQLQELPPLLELPWDRARPPHMTYDGATWPCRWEAELAGGLRQLARRAGATPFVAFISVIAVFLGRYSGREDIPIACPSSQRNRPELEHLIGFFINTLVLRVDLSGDPSFLELLGRVKGVAADAFANQEVPFDRVVDALALERNPSYPPLAQFSAMLLEGEGALPQLSGLKSAPFDFNNPIARYDLTLEMYERGEALELFWLYNTHLFDTAAVARMARHLCRLAQALLAEPEVPLSRISMLDPEERHALLEGWSGAGNPAAPAAYVPQAFEEQAARTPEAVALALGDRRLSYGELNRQANRLARHLAGLGVGPDKTVALCARRSMELVVGLLAILKAGGAYVPLDPDYPDERLRCMLEDCEPLLLLTETALRKRFSGTSLLCLDALPEQIAVLEDGDLNLPIRGEDLAYVIYTSGSTGQPKGCQLEHRSLAHYLGWASRHYFPGEAGGAFALYTSLGFDLTVTSLFLPLVRGKTLTLFPQDRPLDQILREQFDPASGIDAVKITPAHLSLLAQLELPATAVDVAVVGGEQLLAEQARALWKLNPGMRIYNEYGPTEATVGCIVKQILPGEERILIGKPIDGMQAYVLDSHLQPVPPGLPGQLYLGGTGLARGYRRQPQLTAQRFVASPFRPGERLYQSGDLARWSPEGELECLGRADGQVKIRGFRIELGEIEALLGRHPAVRQATVLARDEGSRGRHLVAYVAGAVSPENLSDYLRDLLPDYMVPQRFVVLDALPLDRHGKIDRRALPAPGPVRKAAARDDVPHSPAEQALAAIWASLLGLEQVGIHDNFFELGGDSILSIQAASRATQAGWKLSPRQFFQHQTIAALAQAATPAQTTASAPETVEGPVPLTPIQHRFFRSEPLDPHHYNQTLLLEVHQAWGPALLEQALRALMVHHDALRMRFGRDADGWWQRCEGSAWAERFRIETMDLSDLPEKDQTSAITAESSRRQAGLSLDGPLMRAVYFHLGAGRPARLLWIIHHLLVDGVSWRILLEDLASTCAQMEQSLPVSLPPKTSSYLQWAQRLAAYADSHELRAERDAWLTQARSYQDLPPLPVDFTPGDQRRGLARLVTVALEADETEALLRDVPSVYRTRVNDALLTALALAFSAWTGRDRLRVDVEGHGREAVFEDLDLSRTVGWFTAVAPVCLDLGRVRDPGKALQTVKEQLRRVPRGGIGHDVLRYLAGDEDMCRLPAAQVCFNYLGQVDRILPESSPLVPASEPAGARASLRDTLEYRLAVDGEVEGGRLRFRFQYSRGSYRQDTVEGLAQGFLASLRELIRHCRSPEAGGVTPSDFPLAGLGQAQLDKLALRLRGEVR